MLWSLGKESCVTAKLVPDLGNLPDACSAQASGNQAEQEVLLEGTRQLSSAQTN